jgi:hypothetical protein
LLLIKSDINRVMWSMTVECVATPLILLSVWLFHKHGERPLWILVAILLSLSPVGQYSHLLGGYTSLAPLMEQIIVATHLLPAEQLIGAYSDPCMDYVQLENIRAPDRVFAAVDDAHGPQPICIECLCDRAV